MFALRSSVMGALVGLAGLASLAATPAQADLIVSCTGNAACSGYGGTHVGNGSFVVNQTVIGNFTIGPETINGADVDPTLMDITNLDVDNIGGGTLKLFFTETNLSAGSVADFLMSFTGNLTNFASAKRTFWLDPTNGGNTSIFLGSCSLGTCSLQYSGLKNLSGLFSITEEIDLDATGCTAGHRCRLSSDDSIALVPEPAALSIFGLGLLALGAMGWRRRSKGKLAA